MTTRRVPGARRSRNVPRASSRDESASAEVVAAILLFGIFIAVIAVLNVTAVPQAGLAAEDAHHEDVVDALAGLQAAAEATGNPGSEGAGASRAFALSPPAEPSRGFTSLFMAQPVRASGELYLDPGYGNVTLTHRHGSDPVIHDVGDGVTTFPVGRLVFDPHAAFREPGQVVLENGAVLVADAGGARIRHAPPVHVDVDGSVTHVTVKTRLLHGVPENVGGLTGVRVHLEATAATLSTSTAPNANLVTYRVETAHGEAWAAHFEELADAVDLPAGTTSNVNLEAGEDDALDVVTWTLESTTDSIRLTHGLAAHRVSFR